MNGLPPDELCGVLAHLGTPQLQALRRTCKQFSIVVRELPSERFESKEGLLAAPVLAQRFPDLLEVMRQLPADPTAEADPAVFSMRVLQTSPAGASLIQ